MMLNFEKEPAVGTVVWLDEQAFELAGTQDHIRKDGTATTLLVWQSECADCGAAIKFMSPRKISGLKRRCADCAKPGRPVRGKRGRKIDVRVVPV